MTPIRVNNVFYEKPLYKENGHTSDFKWITIILLDVLLCLVLILLFWRYQENSLGRSQGDQCSTRSFLDTNAFPLVPSSVEDVYDLLHTTHDDLCTKWEVIPSSKASGGDAENKWDGGTSICMDSFSAVSNASNCRIYSVRYDTEDVTFEHRKGSEGCRVHFWGKKTSLSYSKEGRSMFLYPVDIGTSSAEGVYSFDDFVGLLGHQNQVIHYLKSSLSGGHRDLLRSLYASKSKIWRRISQIQMLVYLPQIREETWRVAVEGDYRDLVGLTYLGFKLVRSRGDPRHEYTLNDTQGSHFTFSTIYELVWIKG